MGMRHGVGKNMNTDFFLTIPSIMLRDILLWIRGLHSTGASSCARAHSKRNDKQQRRRESILGTIPTTRTNTHRFPPRPTIRANHPRAILPAATHAQHHAKSNQQFLRLRLGGSHGRMLLRMPLWKRRGVSRWTNLSYLDGVHTGQGGSCPLQRLWYIMGTCRQNMCHTMLPRR